MSFVYHPSAYYSTFLQSFCSVFPQPDLQNQLTSLILSTYQTQNSTIRTGGQFNPILISSPDTCSQISSNENKNQDKPKNKAFSRSKPNRKDENFGWRNQNKDRNVISSILKGYVHFILQHHGSTKQIERLSKISQLQNGVSDFYSFMSKTFQTRKSYVGLRFIQQIICKNVQQSKMAYILRVTLNHYLKSVYPLNIVQDVKIKKKTKVVLLKRARALTRDLFGKY